MTTIYPRATHTRFVGPGPDDTTVHIYVPDGYLYGVGDKALENGVFVGTVGTVDRNFLQVQITGSSGQLTTSKPGSATLTYVDPTSGEEVVMAFASVPSVHAGNPPEITATLHKSGIAEPTKFARALGTADSIEVSNASAVQPERITKFFGQVTNDGDWAYVSADPTGGNVRVFMGRLFDDRVGELNEVTGVEVLNIKGAYGLRIGQDFLSTRNGSTPAQWNRKDVAIEIPYAELQGFTFTESRHSASIAPVAARELGPTGPTGLS